MEELGIEIQKQVCPYPSLSTPRESIDLNSETGPDFPCGCLGEDLPSQLTAKWR